MKWPRWLTWLFPRLLPQGTWKDAVVVTNTATLWRLERIYAEQVAWCKARGFVIQSPECRVTLRYWPERLRCPRDFDGLLGKVLSPNVIPGDTHGTLLVRLRSLGQDWLLAHECKHAITGISDHPKDLFPNG